MTDDPKALITEARASADAAKDWNIPVLESLFRRLADALERATQDRE